MRTYDMYKVNVLLALATILLTLMDMMWRITESTNLIDLPLNDKHYVIAYQLT